LLAAQAAIASESRMPESIDGVWCDRVRRLLLAGFDWIWDPD